MGKKLVSRTAKVLSETKKTKDKEAIAIAYEHIPRNPDELKHGSIYAVIELEDKSGHAEEIAEKIIDALHETYYSDLDKDPLEAFEASLAKINDELTSRSSEGQINWLGKLNAVLAIFNENTLHVTQTGKAEAYLYRGDHAMHVTEDLAGDSVNPQRTFINIASGDLAEKDKIALITPGVFYKLSKSELQKYATENSPKVAVENISKLLSGENGTVKPNAMLLLEMISPESFAADEEMEEKSEVWVTEDKNRIEEVGKGVAGGTIIIFDVIGKAFAGATTFITTKALPAAKEGTRRAKSSLDNFRKNPEAEQIILESEESLSPNKKTAIDTDIDSDDGILETPVENNQEIRIKETRKKPRLLSVERFDFSFLERAKSSLSSRSRKFKLPAGKYSFVYLAIGILLIVSVFGFIGYNNTLGKEKTASENKLNQANTLYEESLGNISAGNYQEASEKLGTAESLAKEVVASTYYIDEANSLIVKINESKDSANRITRNAASLFYEFEANVSQIFTDGELIYGVDFNTGSVISVDPKSGVSAKLLENPDLGGGSISFATLVTQRNTLVAYTTNKDVYEIDLDDGSVGKQSVTGGWEDASAISYFGNNIYLLSAQNNQVYKHIKLSRNYGQKSDYFNSPAPLKDAIGIAIDGSLYTADNTANVTKYTSGVKDEYSLSGLPIEYNNIKGIYTTVDTSGIYLYTSELVVKFDENGGFVAQYANDGAKNIGNLFTLEDEKQIYFVSDNKIYTISY